MASWLGDVARLLRAETSDLRELAGMVGADPRVFYRGADFRQADLTGEDIATLDLTGANLSLALLADDQKESLFARFVAGLLKRSGLEELPGDPEDSRNWVSYAKLLPHVQYAQTSRSAPAVRGWYRLVDQSILYLAKIADFESMADMAALSLFDLKTRLPESHRDLAAAHANLGVAYRGLERWAEAETELRRALALDDAHRPGSADLASSLDLLGGLLVDYSRAGGVSRLPEAAKLHQRALALRRLVFGRHSEPVAQALNNLGAVRDDQRRPRAAARLFHISLSIMRKVIPSGDARLATGAVNSGGSWLEYGVADKAEPLLREALAIREEVFAGQAQHPDRRDAARWLISCLIVRARGGSKFDRWKRMGEAERLCAQYGFDFEERKRRSRQYPGYPPEA